MRLFGPRETAVGADVASPPALLHEPHEPVHVLRQMAELPPRTNTSILPVAFEIAAGAEVAPPGGAPIELQPDDQVFPLRERWWIALSEPRMNTSTIDVPRRADAAGLA